ncbi:MAG TPA: phosphatase PAP2 family protein [Thermoleophilaceae bacterium]|nr:phosphatase PAP2 family protein [Thermoleophilaceae bacterium]
MSAHQAATISLDQSHPATRSRGLGRLMDGRVVRVGAPVIYVIAFAVAVVSWGLPVARDQLFLWIGLGLAAFSVSAWRSWGVMVLEWLPFLGLLVLYDYFRGAVSVAAGQAHVLPQIDADKALFGGSVPSVWLQQHLWTPGHYHWYDYGVWGVYMSHFFAVWVVAAVLWRVSRQRFRRYAVLTITLTIAAFLTYWLYPAQPPWLAAQDGLIPSVDRIVPLVWGHLGVHTMKSAYENGDLVNTVAAMPSLHAAYPFMLMLFFWPAGRLVRVVLGAYTLAMAFTLVYGGEHFVIDILIGWAMAAAAYAAVTWGVNSMQARRASASRRPSPPQELGAAP